MRGKGYIYICSLHLTSWFIFYALLKTMVKGGQGYLLVYIFNKQKKKLAIFCTYVISEITQTWQR